MNQESHWSKLLSTVAETIKRKPGLLSAVLCTAAVIGLFIPTALAAPPFPAVYGGAELDIAYSTQQTNDGGYIVAGRTMSFGAGSDDIWLLKLDTSGGIEWQKTYGGLDSDYTYTIQQTNDGGYIVGGFTKSFGAGGFDMWILKLDGDGEVTWQKAYGGTGDDEIWSIQQTNDGGYIVAGDTVSFGAGDKDMWVLKLYSDGEVTWQKTYGGIYTDFARSIQQTNDGGYIVAGGTRSFCTGTLRTDSDAWIIKLDSSGGIEWQKTYGRVDYDFANGIQQTNDSGYMVMAWTETFPGSNAYDIWLLKLDSDSHIIWQKTYGGPASDLGFSIQQTNDSGYIVAGRTNPFADCWNILLLKIDSNGQVAWQKRYSGIDSSGARSVQQTNDGDYIVAGWAHSLGVVSMPDDQVVLRLDQDGNASGCPLGKPFTGQVNGTTVAGADSSAVTGDTAATVVNTDVSPANSSAKPDHVCESRYLPSILCNR